VRIGKGARIAAAVIVVAIVIGAYAARRAYVGARSQLSESRCDGHTAFVRAQWMDTTMARGKLAVRGCMVDDLLDRHELRGMTRAQVVALIGDPDTVRDLPGYDLVYWLGPQRGLIGTDSEYLAMKLDRSNRVTSVELIIG
jgi:hypothetical protein